MNLSGQHEERLDVGDRVITPKGIGTISFWRFAPPAFNRVDAYNVILDHEKDVSGYDGEFIPADKVRSSDKIELSHRARG